MQSNGFTKKQPHVEQQVTERLNSVMCRVAVVDRTAEYPRWDERRLVRAMVDDCRYDGASRRAATVANKQVPAIVKAYLAARRRRAHGWGPSGVKGVLVYRVNGREVLGPGNGDAKAPQGYRVSYGYSIIALAIHGSRAPPGFQAVIPPQGPLPALNKDELLAAYEGPDIMYSEKAVRGALRRSVKGWKGMDEESRSHLFHEACEYFEDELGWTSSRQVREEE